MYSVSAVSFMLKRKLPLYSRPLQKRPRKMNGDGWRRGVKCCIIIKCNVMWRLVCDACLYIYSRIIRLYETVILLHVVRRIFFFPRFQTLLQHAYSIVFATNPFRIYSGRPRREQLPRIFATNRPRGDDFLPYGIIAGL